MPEVINASPGEVVSLTNTASSNKKQEILPFEIGSQILLAISHNDFDSVKFRMTQLKEMDEPIHRLMLSPTGDERFPLDQFVEEDSCADLRIADALVANGCLLYYTGHSDDGSVVLQGPLFMALSRFVRCRDDNTLPFDLRRNKLFKLLQLLPLDDVIWKHLTRGFTTDPSFPGRYDDWIQFWEYLDIMLKVDIKVSSLRSFHPLFHSFIATEQSDRVEEQEIERSATSTAAIEMTSVKTSKVR